MHSADIDRWRLIVPVKGQLAAKTRLHPAKGVARADLAHAFALDTITAVLDCMPAAHVFVVTTDELTATFVRNRGAVIVADSGGGLNAAITQGVSSVQELLGPGPTAVLLGDIPTLRPDDLVAALSACARHDRAVVPDASGTGTVLLTALPPHVLDPRFGRNSARDHARDGIRLELDLPALRTDVDDDRALQVAVALGVGPRTAAVLHSPQTAHPHCGLT